MFLFIVIMLTRLLRRLLLLFIFTIIIRLLLLICFFCFCFGFFVLPMLSHVHASTNPLEVGAAWLDLVGPRLKSRFEPRGPPLSLALLVHRPLAAAWQRHSSERCWGPLARHKR